MALTHLPIVALVAIGVLVVGRIMALGRRGVRAVVVDRQRTAGEQAFEAAAAALLTWWVYLAVEYANGRGPRWMPGWLDRRLFGAPAGGALGTAILAAGVLLFAAALWSMGDAWRMGIDRAAHRGGAGGQRAHLVTAGVFARSRNPIYLAFDLVLLGSVLVHGRVVILLTAAALAAAFHIQILREERFLSEAHGEAFAAYRRRTRRYF